MQVRNKIATAAMAVGLAAMSAGPAFAQTTLTDIQDSGGAAGLVAAVVQVDDTLNDLVDVNIADSNIEVITVKDSLNNVLQNARFLNNIEIIKNSQVLTDILNNADVDVNVEDVLAVSVLEDGTIVIYQAS